MIEQPREFIVPAGHARHWRMRAGERVTITQTVGHQVGDFIAFNAADLTEFLSTSHTRSCLRTLRIGRGHSLYTNHREPIVDIVEDTVGVHFDACTFPATDSGPQFLSGQVHGGAATGGMVAVGLTYVVWKMV